MSMPGVEANESELRERLTAILRATPPLMRVLSWHVICVSRIGLSFRAQSISRCSII
jgi:hypothetical protein